MNTKGNKKVARKAKDLPAKKLSVKRAKDVRGGSFQAYISVKGKKQG